MMIDDIKTDFIYGWLKIIGDSIIPPYCVEIILFDNSNHYLHSVNMVNSANDSAVLRIWDLRAFNETDIEELKKNLNEIKDRNELAQEQKIHPKLDWANLRVNLNDVKYCIEWHDRLWPEDQRPKMGF
jgi:hypothetical protein